MREFVDDLENVIAAHRTESDVVAAHEQLASQPTQ